MKKKILIIILTVVLSTLPALSTVNAYSLIERESLMMDESLADTSQREYALPKEVIIYRIESPVENLDVDSERWVGLLYYYFVTRLGFADLPFNYLVDQQGSVYEGRVQTEGVVPELEVLDGVVLIGYLSNDSDVPVSAGQSFDDLIEDISYKYGISRDNVNTVDLEISETTSENAPSKLTYTVDNGSVFSKEIKPVLNSVKYSSNEHLDLKGEVTEIINEPEVQIGEQLGVKVTLKNTGEDPWFTNNDFIYLKTADGEDSQFAVNGEWDSFDTPVHVEGKTILPGESVSVEFKMSAVTLPDSFSESFVFTRVGDKKIEGATLNVDFSIVAGDVQIVEILETETGSLNVRATSDFNGTQIAQVDTGKKFIMTGSENGWYEIKYNGTDTGWVYSKYVRIL